MEKITNLDQARRDHRVHDIYFEYDRYNGKTEKWWWIHLKSGYECRSMECGTIHERTLRECFDLLNNDVVKINQQ